jgi:hypothetical protein
VNWKRLALYVAGGVLSLALAFSAGRYSLAPKIETREVVRTEFKTVEKVITVEVASKDKVVYIDRVITKEGEIREKIVEKTVEKRDTKVEKDTKEEAKIATDTKKTVTTDAPRLSVSILAGVDLNPAWQPIPNAGPLALGIAVQYRIAGPLTVGAFGLHTGVFGVSVGANF